LHLPDTKFPAAILAFERFQTLMHRLNVGPQNTLLAERLLTSTTLEISFVGNGLKNPTLKLLFICKHSENDSAYKALLHHDVTNMLFFHCDYELAGELCLTLFVFAPMCLETPLVEIDRYPFTITRFR
jgi:hypothetical protein